MSVEHACLCAQVHGCDGDSDGYGYVIRCAVHNTDIPASDEPWQAQVADLMSPYIYQRHIEYMLRPSPILEAFRAEQKAKWDALPWHRKAHRRFKRRVRDARIRLSQFIYPWSDD